MRLRHGSATDVGRIRSTNQDRVLVVIDRFYAVADGMGGHRGGDTAAQIAVDVIGSVAADNQPLSTGAVVAAIERANTQVLQRSYRDDSLAGMGTTVTALAVVEAADGTELLLVTNVGDSRTYWLRAGEFEQLTEDHSVVAELIREGALDPKDAASHPKRSYVTRALGAEPSVQVDAIEIVAAVGDRFVLCSDGLPNEVTDLAIAAVLRRLVDPQDAADELVRLALGRGGRDNVSVVVVDVVDDDDAAWNASQRVGRDAVTVGGAGPGADRSSSAAAVRGSDDGPGDGSSAALPTRSGSRAPRLLTWRTAGFVVAAALLAGVVAWVVRNGRDQPVVAAATTTTTTTTASTTSTAGSTTTWRSTTSTTGSSTTTTRTSPTATASTRPTTTASTRPATTGSTTTGSTATRPTPTPLPAITTSPTPATTTVAPGRTPATTPATPRSTSTAASPRSTTSTTHPSTARRP